VPPTQQYADNADDRDERNEDQTFKGVQLAKTCDKQRRLLLDCLSLLCRASPMPGTDQTVLVCAATHLHGLL
jgi:hypothetical protein